MSPLLATGCLFLLLHLPSLWVSPLRTMKPWLLLLLLHTSHYILRLAGSHTAGVSLHHIQPRRTVRPSLLLFINASSIIKQSKQTIAKMSGILELTCLGKSVYELYELNHLKIEYISFFFNSAISISKWRGKIIIIISGMLEIICSNAYSCLYDSIESMQSIICNKKITPRSILCFNLISAKNRCDEYQKYMWSIFGNLGQAVKNVFHFSLFTAAMFTITDFFFLNKRFGISKCLESVLQRMKNLAHLTSM